MVQAAALTALSLQSTSATRAALPALSPVGLEMEISRVSPPSST
jgi:hypothetical protein